MPDAPWRVFGSKTFFRLWIAQVVSSLGDWIGLIAILAIAARVSDNSGAAVSLVMTTRVLPGFLLGTVGGVIIDRFDRRKVMVLCDIGRASLLVLLPFVDNIGGLAPRLARARDPHAAVGPGAGRDRPEHRRRRAAVVGELAVARRELRHVPDRVDHLLAARRRRHGAGRLRRHLLVQGRPGIARAGLRRDDVPRVGGDRLSPSHTAARDERRTTSASTGPRPSARSRRACSSSGSTRWCAG